MESSFKKGYDKNVGADGSVEFKFQSERIGAHTGSGLGAVLVLAMFPVSCAVTSPVLYPFYDARARDSLSMGAIFFWMACAAAFWVWSVRKFNIRKTSFLIKPNEGLIFSGKQLPFDDIQTIGTINETTARNVKGTAYVYANTNGTQVKITEYIPLELAEELAREIKNSSGRVWS